MMNRNVSNVSVNSTPQQPVQSPQPYVVSHEFGGPAELTTTLAHAISDVTGVDVTDTGFTLNDYVDPDALDKLFAPKADGTPRTNGHFSFEIWGCQVSVYSNGQIVVTPPKQQAAHPPQ